ncbi:MAG: AAA family ATPase [Pseudomonadota bacterium]
MQHTFLGLTHNPFVPPHEGFFAGGDRKTHLDHLRHLSQWSRRVLAVTGPYGMGKTTLYRQLSNNLEAKTKGARLSGSVVNSEREVLAGLLQGFGVAAHNDAHIDDIISLIVQHVNDQDGLGRTCIAMIDDAHRLDSTALHRLLTVVAESALRVVLFAEAEVIATISAPAAQLELDWFEIRLTGLPRGDVREYLEWRFAQAQYRGRLPFTDAQVEAVVTRSGGNPHAINQLASQMLGELESGEVRKRASKFPLMHMALTVCLIAIIGLAYILVQPPAGSDNTVVAAVDSEATPGPGDAPVEATLPAEITDPVPQDDGLIYAEPSSDQDQADAPTDLSNGAGDVATNPRSGAGTVANSEPQTEVAQSPEPVNEGADDVDAAALDDPDVAAPVVAAPTADVALPGRTTTQESSAPREPVESSPQTGSPTTPAVERPRSPVPVEESSAGVKGVAWLMQQERSRYTLQLVTVSSRERALALVNAQSDASEFVVVPTRRREQTLYVILYGLFTSQAAASAAQPGLRGDMAGLKPWVRPIAQVQGAAYQGG